MLRSLLSVRAAAAAAPPRGIVRILPVASTVTTPTTTDGRWATPGAFFFSSQAAATATRSKPFPPNLKVDPRSSFAPVNKKDRERSPSLQMNTKRGHLKKKQPRKDVSFRPKKHKKDAAPAAAAAAAESQPQRDEEEEEKEGDNDYDDDEQEHAYDDDDDDEDDEWVYEPKEVTTVVPLPDRLHQSIYNFGPPSSSSSNNSTNNNDTNNNDDDDGPEEVGTIWLNPDIFGKDPIRIDLLKRAVTYHRNKKRGYRKAVTKRIGDIRGSTRKVRQQKGLGMARAGHRFPGHWRGGAKAHGPAGKTDYGNTKLNKKVRRLAVLNVLSQKVKEGNLILVNQFHHLPTHKTKVLAQWLEPFGVSGRYGTTALLLDHYFPQREMNENGDWVAVSKNNGDNDDDDETPQATQYNGVPTNLWVASGNQYKVSVGNQLRNLNVYDVLKHEKLFLTLDALKALEERLAD